MKRKLMIRSMSLLALLTLIQNFSVKTEDRAGVTFTCGQFFEANGLGYIRSQHTRMSGVTAHSIQLLSNEKVIAIMSGNRLSTIPWNKQRL